MTPPRNKPPDRHLWSHFFNEPEKKSHSLKFRENLHALIGKLLRIPPPRFVTRAQLDAEIDRINMDAKL